MKPISPNEVSKPPKKKVSKPFGSNSSTSLIAGSSSINYLQSNNPGSSNSLGKPNLTINPETLKSRHESYGLTDNAVGPNFPGSRSSTGGDHGSDTKAKSEKKKKKSSQYVISSASQSPAASKSNSPSPVINNHQKESIVNNSSSQASSPNPTPSFTAMYGSLTAKEPSTSSGDRVEKSKREIEDDSSTETEEDEEDKPPIPKKMKSSTAAEKKMKKPLAIQK